MSLHLDASTMTGQSCPSRQVQQVFYHLLVMDSDGQEVGVALMCDVNQCPVCTCPHDKLDRADMLYPYRWNSQGSCSSCTRTASQWWWRGVGWSPLGGTCNNFALLDNIWYQVRYHIRYSNRYMLLFYSLCFFPMQDHCRSEELYRNWSTSRVLRTLISKLWIPMLLSLLLRKSCQCTNFMSAVSIYAA